MQNFLQPCRGNVSLLEEDIWREQECSSHDNTPYGGELFHWRSHRDDDEPCALTCRGTPQHSGQSPEPVSLKLYVTILEISIHFHRYNLIGQYLMNCFSHI